MKKRQLYLKQALILIILLFLQTTLIPLFAIEMVVPDLILLWLAYIAIRFGQIEATLGGFLAGFAQDVLTTQLFGLTALTKSITGFAAGYFYNENMTEQTLGSLRYSFIVVIMSLLHNILYYFLFYQGVRDSLLVPTLVSSLEGTIYTSLVSIVPLFYFSRKYGSSWIRS